VGEWYVACLARYLPVLGAGYVIACAVAPASGLPFEQGFGTQLSDLSDGTGTRARSGRGPVY
jgi:hypothetical protein